MQRLRTIQVAQTSGSPLLEAVEALRYTTFPKKRVTYLAFQQGVNEEGQLISPAPKSLASRRILA
jgi:hypothetical protein